MLVYGCMPLQQQYMGTCMNQALGVMHMQSPATTDACATATRQYWCTTLCNGTQSTPCSPSACSQSLTNRKSQLRRCSSSREGHHSCCVLLPPPHLPRLNMLYSCRHHKLPQALLVNG
jgi:hypothetical protein